MDWIDALDEQVFGSRWGEGAPHERLVTEPPVGYARWAVIAAAGEAELLRVAVAPSARRSGIARALLQRSEAELRGTGVRVLFLEVRESNAAARRLYEATGWSECGRRRGYYPDGETAVLYRKPL
ncbi:MAG: GNAT family N-acetyltransferase [Myxococcales bacterium]